MNGNNEANIIINENNLDALNKQQQMVLNLNQRISKIQEDFQRVNNLRFYHLERILSMTKHDTLVVFRCTPTTTNNSKKK